MFLLAKFYHLLSIYFGVGDYCLSNSLTASLWLLCFFFKVQLTWLGSANNDKTTTPNR